MDDSSSDEKKTKEKMSHNDPKSGMEGNYSKKKHKKMKHESSSSDSSVVDVDSHEITKDNVSVTINNSKRSGSKRNEQINTLYSDDEILPKYIKGTSEESSNSQSHRKDSVSPDECSQDLESKQKPKSKKYKVMKMREKREKHFCSPSDDEEIIKKKIAATTSIAKLVDSKFLTSGHKRIVRIVKNNVKVVSSDSDISYDSSSNADSKDDLNLEELIEQKEMLQACLGLTDNKSDRYHSKEPPDVSSYRERESDTKRLKSNKDDYAENERRRRCKRPINEDLRELINRENKRKIIEEKDEQERKDNDRKMFREDSYSRERTKDKIWERERRSRERDRYVERERDRDIDRERDRYAARDRDYDRERDRHFERERDRYGDRSRDRSRDREYYRQPYSNKMRDSSTDRNMRRYKENDYERRHVEYSSDLAKVRFDIIV